MLVGVNIWAIVTKICVLFFSIHNCKTGEYIGFRRDFLPYNVTKSYTYKTIYACNSPDIK